MQSYGNLIKIRQKIPKKRSIFYIFKIFSCFHHKILYQNIIYFLLADQKSSKLIKILIFSLFDCNYQRVQFEELHK